MIKEVYKLLIITIIIVWGIVIKKYTSENKKYKNSSYGKQSKNSFLKIIADKGSRGEYRTSEILEKMEFNKKMIFNCYIPNRSGEKTEIDIIVISKKGIYVVENKNYSGWIFGDEKSKNWCEIINGKKYFFYNPIKQNQSHIKNLEKLLKIGDEKYISLITLNAGAKIKKIETESENLYVIGYEKLNKFVKEQKEKTDCLSDEEIDKIYQILLPGTQIKENEKQKHINRIRKEYKNNFS